MFTTLIKIRQTLIQIIHLYQILISQKKAEVFPGRSQTVSRIRAVAKKYNVDPNLAVRVARCESGFNPTAVRVNLGQSVDRGLFQWNDFYHPEISNDCAFDIECSTSRFCQAVKAGHLNWWNNSQHCWH